ncbi:transporter substrate-binding domain-containing protein [Oxalobacteraceae bacterium]|nr:transporter substrate-binding domain-containing protein [Oxalobacteraceae bacterium]
MMARLARCSILLALAAALPASAWAFSCPALTRVGISDLGYSSYQDGPRYRGTSIDIVEELGRRTGCRFELIWFPRSRLFAQFDAGLVDMAMASSRSDERERKGRYIPYTYTQFELVLSKKVPGSFRSLADFVDHSSARLNITRGVYYPPEAAVQLERLQAAGRLEYVSDYDVVFRKIQSGRAEGTFSPPAIHLLHQRRYHMSKDMVSYTVPETPRRIIGAYVSRANVPFPVYRHFASAIGAIVADGTVQRIYARHLGPGIAKQMFAGGVRELLDAIEAQPQE